MFYVSYFMTWIQSKFNRISLGWLLQWGQINLTHACLEQHPTETKVLRWDFHNFGLHYIHTYQNNWIWNQNQREFWENAIFSFQILKYCLILKVFDTFSLCNLKTKHFLCLVWKRRVGERYQLMTLGTKILEFGPFWAKLWLFSWQN